MMVHWVYVCIHIKIHILLVVGYQSMLIDRSMCESDHALEEAVLLLVALQRPMRAGARACTRYSDMHYVQIYYIMWNTRKINWTSQKPSGWPPSGHRKLFLLRHCTWGPRSLERETCAVGYAWYIYICGCVCMYMYVRMYVYRCVFMYGWSHIALSMYWGDRQTDRQTDRHIYTHTKRQTDIYAHIQTESSPEL